jgi:hypothetical protein
MTETDETIRLARRFADVSQLLLERPSVEQTLQEIVDLAARTIDGAMSASITVVDDDGVIGTPAYSAEIARDVDLVQADVGEGPCLDAGRYRMALRIDDMSAEERWPRFAERTLELGVKSMIACDLNARRGVRRAALNIHSAEPATFDEAAVETMSIYAAHSSAALGQASLVESLRAALGSRQVIGEATGILMERHRLGSREAFTLLRETSQRLNAKLRVVAEYVVLTGQDPSVIRSLDLRRPR